MPPPKATPAEPAALVVAAERVATVRIIERLRDQLEQAEAEHSHLQQKVDRGGDAATELAAAVEALPAAQQRVTTAHARLVATRARLQLLAQDAAAPPEFAELRERVASLAKHPRFQRQAAKVDSPRRAEQTEQQSTAATNGKLFEALVNGAAKAGRLHSEDDSGSDGFDSAGSDDDAADDSRPDGGTSPLERSTSLAADAPNWSSEEELEPPGKADAQIEAHLAQQRRLQTMAQRPAPEPEPEPEPAGVELEGSAVSVDDVFFEVTDDFGGWELASSPPVAGGGDRKTSAHVADAAGILAEIESKTRELDAEQLAAVSALQQAQTDAAHAAHKQLEACEKEEIVASLLAELEAAQESVDSFFEKQGMREKVCENRCVSPFLAYNDLFTYQDGLGTNIGKSQNRLPFSQVDGAGAERLQWVAAQELATTRVSSCVNHLVNITVKVKCFRLNREMLRRRCAAASGEASRGSSGSQEEEEQEEERALAARMEELQGHAEAHREQALLQQGELP
jgi:hypothetical protein